MGRPRRQYKRMAAVGRRYSFQGEGGGKVCYREGFRMPARRERSTQYRGRRRKASPGGEGWQFEPQVDGFRTLVFRDGDEILLQSRDEKPMNRYFPELIVVATGNAWSMKSIKRLISVGRSTKAARSSERLISVEVSPGWLMAPTMKPASASVSAVS
jgi:hypothetical protein